MEKESKKVDTQLKVAKNKTVSFEFKSKKEFILPKGSTIVSKNCRVTVEEISNGFLIIKSWEISYMDSKKEKHWDYFDQKYYSKENLYEEVLEESMELVDKL